MAEWPEERTQTQQAWEDYREGGGILAYQEWVDSGKPTIIEEKANIAWLNRFSDYLSAQVESGVMTKEEAVLTGQDVQSRLFGQGNYVGNRQTILNLPQSILSDVESYTKQLITTKQKNWEQAQKEQQDINEAVLTQRAQLPLNAGGNIQQQVKAGYDAIRNLKLQIQTPNLPEVLKGTMQSQVLQLEQAINQLNQSARLQARAKTEQESEVPKEGSPEPGTFAKEFAARQGMSAEAAAQTGARYFQDPQSEEFANLTDEEKKGLTWVGIEAAGGEGTAEWEAAHPPPPETVTPPSFREIGASGSPAWKNWFEQNYPGIAREFTGRPEPEQRTATKWSEFLVNERKRIQEEFYKQSPYSRGERPGVFAPKIKTVAF